VANVPDNLSENVAFSDDHYIIAAPHGGRIWPIMGVGALFLTTAYYFVKAWFDWSGEQLTSNDYAGIVVIGCIATASGIMFFRFIINLLTVPEAHLLPEQRKIIIRSARTQKLLSEHSIDDIEVRIESVHHEDPSRTPMRWFTLFDTNRQKQIFAVRTAGHGGETYDTAELKEFFYEVMGKKS
jgi:hypothetical protein